MMTMKVDLFFFEESLDSCGVAACCESAGLGVLTETGAVAFGISACFSASAGFSIFSVGCGADIKLSPQYGHMRKLAGISSPQ